MMRTAGDSVEQPPPLSRASTLPDDAAAASAFVAQSCAARMPRAARDQAFVGVVATAAYLSIAIFWLARGINAITGDEPHYLVAAHALVYNHSLDLRPVYGHGQWAGLGGGQFHTVDSGDAVLPGHGLAISALIALPYRFFGVWGAKVTLCVLAGMLVSVAYPVLRDIVRQRWWSLAGALVIALSLPNTMGAGQIFPDLIAGLLPLYLLYQIARGFPVGDRRWPRLLSFAVAAGVLPWLHHRHVPIAATFDAAFLLRFLYDDGAERHAARRATRSGALRSAHLLVPLGVMVGMQVLELAYTLWLVGTLVYPAQPHFLGWYSVMIALGLHLDQFHGIFFQNPLFFAALAGLPIFMRRTPRLFALWALVYVLSVVPVTAHPSGYGGWAFAGRYEWDFAPLWIFPLGHFMSWLLQRRAGRPALAVLLGGALALQALLASRWVVAGFLIQDTSRPLWALDGFYSDLHDLLPVFARPERLLTDWPNWVWLGLAVITVLFTAVSRTHRTAMVAAVCAATALAALLLVKPRPTEPFNIVGAGLFRSTGHNEGMVRVVSEGTDGPGLVIFGPFLALRPGCYETALFYDADYPPDGRPAIWESHGAGRSLGRGEVTAARPGAVLRQLVRVAPGEKIPNFEVRVWFGGSGRVRIEKLVIAPSPACPAAGGGPT